MGLGAVLGWPMSTTHVACGALVGTGLARDGSFVNGLAVRNFLLAWAVTVPAGAALGIASYGIARSLIPSVAGGAAW